jgi:glutathione S-transferase
MSTATRPRVYRVYGLMQSFFTRKMTGYLDYKGIPWRLHRSAMTDPRLAEVGFPGGMPAVESPEGEFMWDSTAMILHLEHRFPEPSVLPPDPVQRFLSFVVEDVCDEWLYRPAVGSRWHVPENAAVGGFELARDMTAELPLRCDDAFAGVGFHVRSSCPPLGVTETSIARWIDEVLRPWQRALGSHLAARPFLFGDRPSLADFAVFGANAAHFVNDPACRRWTEEDAPALVEHTHRLLQPEDHTFGAWAEAADVPQTLIALLAEAGRLYLPWVSRATVAGEAAVEFAGGPAVTVRATPFLIEARATLLARYAASRSPALDALLERAGILEHFASHVGQAGRIPEASVLPRPALNRPYPPEGIS